MAEPTKPDLSDPELIEALQGASTVLAFSHLDTGQDGLRAVEARFFESDELLPIERHKLAHMLMTFGEQMHDEFMKEMEEEADRG